MSGSEEKKLNSLHEVDSLYKVQGGKAAYQISPAADTGRGKGNDGSEDLPKASDSSFTGK